MTLLEAQNVSVTFGGIRAVRGVSVVVAEGELLGLIGPNGAGKTTFLRLLSGVVRPDTGKITFDGHDVTGASLDARARRGLELTHQIVRPFRQMTLVENVAVAAEPSIVANPWRALMKVDRATARERAMALLGRLGIADAADRPARELPLGYLKRMQIARALATGPRLLMLDEPLAGLNHAEATRIGDLIQEINREGRTIILIEHNIAEVVRVARRLVVLNQGEMLAEGDPAAVMGRPEVRRAYLGETEAGHA